MRSCYPLLLSAFCLACTAAQTPISVPASPACTELETFLQSTPRLSDLITYYQIQTEKLLITARDTTAYANFRLCFKKLTKSVNASEIDFIHHYEWGRYGLIEEQLSLARHHLDQAFQLQSTHLPLREMLRDLTFRRAQELLKADDPPALRTFLRQAAENYSFLLEDRKFRELLIFTSDQPD